MKMHRRWRVAGVAAGGGARNFPFRMFPFRMFLFQMLLF